MRRSVSNSPNTLLDIQRALQAKRLAEVLAADETESETQQQETITTKVSEPKDLVAETGTGASSSRGGRLGGDNAAYRGQWTAPLPAPAAGATAHTGNAERYRIHSNSPGRAVEDSRGRMQYRDRAGRFASAPRADPREPLSRAEGSAGASGRHRRSRRR